MTGNRPRADRLLWAGAFLGVAYSTVLDLWSWVLAAPVVSLGLVAVLLLTARWLDGSYLGPLR